MYTGSELKLNKEECKSSHCEIKGVLTSLMISRQNDRTYYLFLLIASTFDTRLVIDDDTWWSTQSWLTTLLSSLIARERIRPQTL